MLGLQGPFGKEETAIRRLEGGSVRVAFSRVIKAPLAQPFLCAKVQIVLQTLKVNARLAQLQKVMYGLPQSYTSKCSRSH